jgi:hypothetical protein
MCQGRPCEEQLVREVYHFLKWRQTSFVAIWLMEKRLHQFSQRGIDACVERG